MKKLTIANMQRVVNYKVLVEAVVLKEIKIM
jgi:hypothetical protein